MNEENTIINLENTNIFQGGKCIVADINMKVRSKEFAYLIGKVGSGKTSILKTLYGELKPVNGIAKVTQYNLHSLKTKHIPLLRREMGIVFQDFQLLTDRKVYDNLLFALKATGWKKKDEINQRIDETLEKVGLPDKKFKMPHELSGGEQQRIVIARALLNKPSLILADEPTGNLDPETSEGIMNLLFEIKNEGTTVVMATHNYILLKKYPAKTYRCIDGKLEEITETENAIDFDALQ
ncbi:MAG: phosphonate ABC transporter ATP-binding protein [Marinilabiliales bacterium]|nr:MAG: phosphonate ABC transporter ATP-binding protein [Marinilabiliales bacterium]